MEPYLLSRLSAISIAFAFISELPVSEKLLFLFIVDFFGDLTRFFPKSYHFKAGHLCRFLWTGELSLFDRTYTTWDIYILGKNI